MVLTSLLRKLSLPATLLLPGILNIQAEGFTGVHPPMQPGAQAIAPVPLAGTVRARTLLPRISEPGSLDQSKVVTQPLSSLYIKFNGLQAYMANGYALNPTGGPVRKMGMDWWGSGEYRAPRYDPHKHKRYRHNGIDYVGKPNTRVLAPISGELRRTGKGPIRGAVIVGYINGKKHLVRLLHFNTSVPNGYVVQGQTIGRVLNLGRYYRGMLSHVHMEVHEWRGMYNLKEKNPARYVRNTPS